MDTDDLTLMLIAIANYQYFLSHYPVAFFFSVDILVSISHLQNVDKLAIEI